MLGCGRDLDSVKEVGSLASRSGLHVCTMGRPKLLCCRTLKTTSWFGSAAATVGAMNFYETEKKNRQASGQARGGGKADRYWAARRSRTLSRGRRRTTRGASAKTVRGTDAGQGSGIEGGAGTMAGGGGHLDTDTG